MADHVTNRNRIVRSLREELFGPAPAGEELDCSRAVRFEDAKQSFKPWCQQGTGEEILQRDTPTKRYGIGVLYPVCTLVTEETDTAGVAAIALIGQEATPVVGGGELTTSFRTDAADKTQEDLERRLSTTKEETNTDIFDLSAANTYRPGSMGISFLTEFPDEAKLVIEATGGRYRAMSVIVAGHERIWWLRSPVELQAKFAVRDLCALRNTKLTAQAPDSRDMAGIDLVTATNVQDLDLRIEVYSRPYEGSEHRRLITVCLVNRSRSDRRQDEQCLFQSFFKAWIEGPQGLLPILPYPGPPTAQLDKEEQSLALLYRQEETFAVGHGCAANWDLIAVDGQANWVSADCLPVFETPSTTPDITREDKTPLQVPMAPLAGLLPGDDGFASIAEVVSRYNEWISQKQNEIISLEERYKPAAIRHMQNCTHCVERMTRGLEYLRTDPVARQAFQLANYAILLQQVHSRREARLATYNEKAQRITFSPPYTEPDLLNPVKGRGTWRAFQIAFLLMAMQSSVEGDALDRETVELIWFPTGGGKTEAYLGLAAFTLFMRRLRDPEDLGVQILMRYTLRLLTVQQFQRAAGLICAMENLRKQNVVELGKAQFSIGIWVGGENTPNTHAQAITVLNGLSKADRAIKNKFILGRCPWCGAQMGPLEYKDKASKLAPRVLGYYRQGETVVFRCPDKTNCEFAGGIPVYVIDDAIYIERPSLLIGTVDKFAVLAWRDDARSLFGLGSDGERISSPPGLIIQDELHLISGPLGSMVGLYEGVIEELCTDRRGDHKVVPKIIASTATIRRYEEQVKALYARENTALFPPPGLEASDSFFARYARQPDGSLEHGRMYVGVHAPGLGSMQTVQVRTFTALLQAPVSLTGDERDPWWTLLLFFNSLRELGTTLSLFQSDIPDYFKVLLNRSGIELSAMRRFWELRELTGRLASDEVPEAITALEVSCTSTSGQKPVDVCLASNILEVGVDIDRLSLMAVVGQPKTTAQYIQVTGRVGRQWKDRPGLVVMLYGASKPRDRSHFEKFRSYHERLYAQVEPTSVTPFSPPALDRALHATMVSYVRQMASKEKARSPYPYPEDLIQQLQVILENRVQIVDKAEASNFITMFKKRAQQWRNWQRSKWTATPSEQDIPLLREAGAYADAERTLLSWATPQSMRTVDAECQAQITTLYLPYGDNDNE